MAHFEDFSPCSYFPGSSGLGFKAVGWLERGHEYPKGHVSAEFFEKLLIVLQNPWSPPIASPGIHACQLCQFSAGRAEFSFTFGKGSLRHYRVSGVGNSALYVPAGKELFVSPSSIAHYIDAHSYLPPPEFQQAVINCPEMRSTAYLRALLATPAKDWLRSLNEFVP